MSLDQPQPHQLHPSLWLGNDHCQQQTASWEERETCAHPAKSNVASRPKHGGWWKNAWKDWKDLEIHDSSILSGFKTALELSYKPNRCARPVLIQALRDHLSASKDRFRVWCDCHPKKAWFVLSSRHTPPRQVRFTPSAEEGWEFSALVQKWMVYFTRGPHLQLSVHL